MEEGLFRECFDWENGRGSLRGSSSCEVNFGNAYSSNILSTYMLDGFIFLISSLAALISSNHVTVTVTLIFPADLVQIPL